MTMKASELADLDTDELAAKLAEAKEELFNLRFQNVTGQLDNRTGCARSARTSPGPYRDAPARALQRGSARIEQDTTTRQRPAGPARSAPGSWSPTRWTRRWSSRWRTSASTACTRRRSGGRPGSAAHDEQNSAARATPVRAGRESCPVGEQALAGHRDHPKGEVTQIA